MQSQLAFVLCYIYRGPTGMMIDAKTFPTIYTIRFEGETESDVCEKLNKALAVLSFPTAFRAIIFDYPGEALKLLQNLEVIEVIDSPETGKVCFSLNLEYDLSWFLPRDPMTRDFIDITKKPQCLRALKIPEYLIRSK